METASREIIVRYFAWVREQTGCAQERVTLPANLTTIGDVARWMQTRGGGYERAFAKPQAIRAAIDHKHVPPSALIEGAREIGFFPPVTGG